MFSLHRHKKRSKDYYDRKALIKKYKKIVFDIGLYYNIELPKEYEYNDDLMSFLSVDQNIRLVNWKGIENYLASGANKETALYIDGRRIKSEELPSISLKMDNVENIMVQPIKGNQLVQVFTTENYKNNITTLFKEYVFNEGYDKAKKYYTSQYDFNQKNDNAQFEIDWKPDLITNDLGQVNFKIKKSNNYFFFIQGFSKNGFLISDIIKNE